MTIQMHAAEVLQPPERIDAPSKREAQIEIVNLDAVMDEIGAPSIEAESLSVDWMYWED